MISLEQLHFSYAHTLLFENLHLEIAPGSVCGLLGRNGAGKTTLMKVIAGLRFADGGRVNVLGFNPAERHPDFLAEVFYLPEVISLPNVPAKSYVREMAPFYPKFDRAQYDQLVAEFDLPTRARLGDLSLGESRKIMLAFALAAGCRLLLLDEPANGLDIPSRKQLRKLLALALREDRAIIVSTHQVHDLEALIDSIAILNAGAIVLNEGIESLTRRLYVGRVLEEPDPATVLYSERVAGGYLVVKERVGEPETALDLEVLFQAAITDPHRLKAIFGRTDTYAKHELRL